MPIANCIVSVDKIGDVDLLVARWAQESGESTAPMTVNIIRAAAQGGQRYAVMATLYLPSCWSPASVSALQLGLARALAAHFAVAASAVQVISHILPSGRVVENGEEVRWP